MRLEESVIRVLKPHTTMEDGTPLGWDQSPNDAVVGRTDKEDMMIKAPIGTVYIQSNGTIWEKGLERWYMKRSRGHPHTIHAYWGRASDLEPGWAICDGTNGTPDLRDKEIIGAATDAEVGTIKTNKVNLSVALPVLTQTAPDAVRLYWITYIGP